MKRLGALVLALGLIGGAIAANRSIHSSDTAGGAAGTAARVRVVCSTEFAAACRALGADAALAGEAEFSVAAPGTTVAALVSDPSASFDLWLTSRPWPEIAAVRAQAADRPAPRLALPSTPLASAALSAVGRTAAATPVTQACGADFSATCLLDGSATMGLRPTTETAGMLAVGAFIERWPGLEDPDVVAIDTDDAFRSAFSRARTRSKSDNTPIRTILTQPKFVFAFDIAAAEQLATASNASQFTTLTTDVTAIAVAVPAATATGRAALARLGRDKVVNAIVDQGWSTKIPDDDGLPDPAVLDQLVTRWTTP